MKAGLCRAPPHHSQLDMQGLMVTSTPGSPPAPQPVALGAAAHTGQRALPSGVLGSRGSRAPTSCSSDDTIKVTLNQTREKTGIFLPDVEGLIPEWLIQKCVTPSLASDFARFWLGDKWAGERIKRGRQEDEDEVGWDCRGVGNTPGDGVVGRRTERRTQKICTVQGQAEDQDRVGGH